MKKRVLWICQTHDACAKRREQLGDSGLVKFHPVFGALLGSSFELIVLDGIEWNEKIDEWFKMGVRCRLQPGGQIITTLPC